MERLKEFARNPGVSPPAKQHGREVHIDKPLHLHPHSDHDGDGPCGGCAPPIKTTINDRGQVVPITAAAYNLINGSNKLPKMQRALLTALVQHGEMPKAKLLLRAGYARSGEVSKCFASMGRAGWTFMVGGLIGITPAGCEALGAWTNLPTGHALREQISAKLAKMPRKLFEAVCQLWPEAVSKGDLLKHTGYARSGEVSKAFAYLAAIGYVTKEGSGMLRASEELFT
jgi:hypothetical protein